MFVGSGFSLFYLYSVHLELEWSGRIRQPGSQACVSRRTGKQGPVEAYWGPAVGQCHSTAPCTAPCTAHLRTCQRCISGCGLGVGPLRGRCKRRDGQMGRWADGQTREGLIGLLSECLTGCLSGCLASPWLHKRSWGLASEGLAVEWEPRTLCSSRDCIPANEQLRGCSSRWSDWIHCNHR